MAFSKIIKQKNNVVLGIDVGTSYIKGALRNFEGLIISTFRKQTSVNTATNLIPANKWWSDIKRVILEINSNYNNQNHIEGICISAISPTLTVFDAINPDNAYSILYSSVSINKKFTEQYHHSLTKERLSILKGIAKQKRFKRPFVTDLVGYINYRLTGEFTINSISLSCMGAAKNTFTNSILNVSNNIFPRIVSVTENIGKVTKECSNELGMNNDISVCGGCSDVMGSIVGSGMQKSSDRIIYLGTFGSLLQVEQKIDDLLISKNIKKQPFNFLLSVPGFGKKIENLSYQWFFNTPSILADKAIKIAPDAEGTKFLLPRWKNGMQTVGKYEFIPSGISDLNIKSRAVLESIAYAVRIIEDQSSNDIYICGGGAQNNVWLDIISIVLQNNVKRLDYSWESAGTADIASKMCWGKIDNERSVYTSQTNFHVFKEVIDKNYREIKKYYNDRNWL